jgi:hypothetical protein
VPKSKKYKTKKKKNGVIKLEKSNEKLSEENAELLEELDYITKIEIMEAIKKIADEVGVKVSFTFDELKNKI